ncbi:MAG: hypothetical protein ACTTIR_06195 [Eggerthia catenaformis]|uniref:hypothetical protein n=1 Tax=Eggerthia catenaformis TaxID=31973 RepID=UPI003F9FA4E6
MKKTYEDFKKLVKVIELDGYAMRYNECSGEYEFVNENEIISIYDHYNEETCSSDWDRICKDLKEKFNYLF